MADRPGYSIRLPIPYDSEINRDRVGRAAFFFVCLTLFGLIPFLFGAFFGDLISDEAGDVVGLIGVVIGFLAFRKFAAMRLIISNDGLTGCYTTNWAGDFVVYGPGFHFSYPWEDRSQNETYPLEVETTDFDVKVPTTTSLVIAKCQAEWRYSLRRLVRATNLTPETLEDGFQGFVDAIIADEVSGESALTALGKKNDLNDHLKSDFMTTEHPHTRDTPSDFEEKFGLDIAAVFIKHFEFPENVQRARDAVAEAHSVHEIAATLYAPDDPKKLDRDIKAKRISQDDYKALVEQALIIAKDAKLNVVSLKGTDNAAKTLWGLATVRGDA